MRKNQNQRLYLLMIFIGITWTWLGVSGCSVFSNNNNSNPSNSNKSNNPNNSNNPINTNLNNPNNQSKIMFCSTVIKKEEQEKMAVDDYNRSGNCYYDINYLMSKKPWTENTIKTNWTNQFVHLKQWNNYAVEQVEQWKSVALKYGLNNEKDPEFIRSVKSIDIGLSSLNNFRIFYLILSRFAFLNKYQSDWSKWKQDHLIKLKKIVSNIYQNKKLNFDLKDLRFQTESEKINFNFYIDEVKEFFIDDAQDQFNQVVVKFNQQVILDLIHDLNSWYQKLKNYQIKKK
ncbi:putative lipoprotein [[Mycoplasma] cavipharyngis]|uniref:hypothetical protein n=1 Tax=[Mycoplasma] cavipharyngis TaxID=92757 RepID=UPI0037042C47